MPELLKILHFQKYNFFFFLSLYNIKNGQTYWKRKQYQYKKRGILRPLSAPARYIKRKVKSIY